jgi:O-acetyl-ADP-ribose deacetylase (regulator of RNase III)
MAEMTENRTEDQVDNPVDNQEDDREGSRIIVATLGATRFELVEGDITELDVEAIVNAANEQLQLGTGVAGAIRVKGGPTIQEECDRIGGTPVGTAVMTAAGNLKARHVIHAVGPRMGEGDEDKKLAAAVRAALALADRRGVKSIALPALSTGNFGFPIDRAARILLTEIHRFLQGGTKLDLVVVVLHGEEAFGIFKRELRRGFR